MTRLINSSEFVDEVLNNNELIMVDFSAEWCGPCKMLAPVVDQLSREMEGTAKVFKIDIDKSGDIAQRYNVMSVPTVIIFKNRTVVDKIVGFNPKEVYKRKLEEHSK